MYRVVNIIIIVHLSAEVKEEIIDLYILFSQGKLQRFLYNLPKEMNKRLHRYLNIISFFQKLIPFFLQIKVISNSYLKAGLEISPRPLA